jgi:hypothetical protein
VVAVGSLEQVWLDLPDFESKQTLMSAFNAYFNADWNAVMVGAEKPFGYHASYDAYFAVRNLRPVNDLTVDQLLASTGVKKPINIVAG